MKYAAVRDVALRYSCAVGVGAVGLWFHSAVERWTDAALPLISFLPCVIVATFLGGAGPGLLTATLLAFLAVIDQPYHGPWHAIDAVRLGAFVCSSLMILALERLRQDRLAKHDVVAQDRFRALIEYVDAIVFLKDLQGRYLMVNRRHAEAFGRSVDQVVGLTDADFRPAEVAAEVQEQDRKVLQQRTVVQSVVQIERNGELRTYHSIKFPLFDDRGQVSAIGGMATDVTDQHKAQRRLSESEARFGAAFEHSAIGMALVDVTGRWLQVNPALCKLTGYSREELLATDFQSITHSDDLQEDLDLIRRLIQGQIDYYHMEKRYLHRSGETIWVMLSVSLVRDPEGHPLYFVSQMQDISEQRRTMADLESARQAADSANRAKSTFLANMSHEIRTPLTAILGYADLLMQPEAEFPLCQEAAHVIRRNGEHLLGLLNDLLDLSKIEAGRMTVEVRPTPLLEVIKDTLNVIRAKAVSKGLELKLTWVGQVPQQIRTDPTRLRQILLNLLGNAAKFTEVGSIEIRVGMTRQDNRDLVQIEVQDTGIGISLEQQIPLFEAFVQADDSISRRFGGTGLGLMISRRLARMLGGEITVESELGKGSTFTLTIAAGSLDRVPLIATTGSQTLVARPDVPTGKLPHLHGRILVAEDGPDVQSAVCRVLKIAGCDAVPADTGQAAVARAMGAMASGQPFDAILMDIQMPEMDGLEATSLLRSRGYTGPIIAVSASAMDSDRSACLAAGCNEFVPKPIQWDLLMDTLQSAMATSHAGKLTTVA